MHRRYGARPREDLGCNIDGLRVNLEAIEAMMYRAAKQLKDIALRAAYTREHLPDARDTKGNPEPSRTGSGTT
jgi:hypothetical protein